MKSSLRARSAAVGDQRAPTGTTTGGNYSVRELLELERKIYQESIDRSDRQHKALMDGTLEDFVTQCVPFDEDRKRECVSALVHLHLNKRNGFDLLQFELKQANDVYQEQRRVLKRRLIESTEAARARVLERLEELKRGDASCPIEIDEVESETCESPREATILLDDGRIDREALVKELEAAQAATHTAFNLQHLQYNIPPPQQIARDVMEETAMLGAFERARRDPVSSRVPIAIETDPPSLTVGVARPLELNDYVILWSALSEEDFYGQITGITRDAVELVLACGTPVTVSVDRLRRRECTLKPQDAELSPRNGTHASSSERFPLTPRTPRDKKRHRRKHTLGPLQKF